MILLQFLTILYPYKMCVTEERTYVNNKHRVQPSKYFNSFVVNTPLIDNARTYLQPH